MDLQQLSEGEKNSSKSTSDTVPVSALSTVVNIKESLPGGGKPNLTATMENVCKGGQVNLGFRNDEKNFQNRKETSTTAQLSTDKIMNDKENEKCLNCCRRYLGIGLALCSSMVFSLSFLIVKALPQYNQFSLCLWRFVGILVLSFPILIYYQLTGTKSIFEPLWPVTDAEKRKTFISLMLRGIVGSISTVLQFWSLKYMDMADSTVIAFSTPVFVTFLAYFVLGEKCGIVPVLAGVLTIGGVVIIARPPFLTGGATFDSDLIIGTILALGSMIFSTGVFVVLRFLRKVNFAIVTTSFGLIGVLMSLILCASVSRLDLPQNGWDWILGSSVGILTFFGQLLLTVALKFENAGTISLVRTNDVIFAFIWQLIFLSVIPDSYTLIGSLVVVSGVVIVGFRKWLDELPESNRLRQVLWFLLK